MSNQNENTTSGHSGHSINSGSDNKFNDCTSRIIGCAMRVHSFLGNGFQEVIYQRALEIEMNLERLQFVREMEMPIFYRDVEIGTDG